MTLAHVTQTGNISIPKKWREELGIEPGSNIVMEKMNYRIIIEPLKENKDLAKIDEEIRKKKISFTTKEAIKDDLYD